MKKKQKWGLLEYATRTRMPQPGESVAIYQHQRLLAAGSVINSDGKTITIAGTTGLVDLDTEALRRGLNDGSVLIKRHELD